MFGRKILIIDDSEPVREHVAELLGPMGYEIVRANDGFDALQQFVSHPDIGLVFCDITMPRMNGLELLERCSSVVKRIPFVMLTTESNPKVIQEAKRLGARGWVVKPFKHERLLALAERLLPTERPTG